MYARESVACWLDIINTLVWKNSIKWDFCNNNINSKSITRKQSDFFSNMFLKLSSRPLLAGEADSADPNSLW